MDITGAVFDCDGTLLDSMPMWHDVTVEFLRDLGVADPEEVFGRSEHRNMHNMCNWWHSELHLGESGDQLYDELYRRVGQAYETRVRPFPGAADFLRELSGAGVRMVVASSTASALVRRALRRHGLLQFFSEIVPTDGLAHGKDYPDIYLRAAEVLGTPKESTWAFEDAPFALSSARRAGLRTVALFNDHDGRDEYQVRQNADIFVHGYGELSLALIHDFAPQDVQREGVLRVLVVDGSPCASSPELVSCLAGESDYVIAVDRGAQALRSANVTPDLFCGDSDSADPDVARWAREVARDEVRYPSEKYVTDLGLAIWCARNEAARRGRTLRLTLTCATGGRPDQALAVIGLLAKNADAAPRVVEDDVEWRVLSPEGCLRWNVGASAAATGSLPRLSAVGTPSVAVTSSVEATFSAIALREGTVVSEVGSKWELDHHELGLLDDMGISNVVASPDARVVCHSGVVAVYLLR